MKKLAMMFFVGCAMALGGCSKKPSGKAAPASTASATAGGSGAAEALTLFKTKCSVCHGMAGKGDGPGSAALNPKPRNFTDAKWQDSVTDDHIKKTILGGGMAVGKSPVMPSNPDLKGKDAVLDALVKKVRSFKGK